MKLPTSYLPEKPRSATRFVIVGTTGMFLQDGIYRLALHLLGVDPQGEAPLVFLAFAIGFIIEMILNYFVSAWYTFGVKPSFKNAGGFIVARVINYGVQNLFLYLLILFGLAANNAGFPSIFLAGIVNFFILRLFFKQKNKNPLVPPADRQTRKPADQHENLQS